MQLLIHFTAHQNELRQCHSDTLVYDGAFDRFVYFFKNKKKTEEESCVFMPMQL